MRLPTDYVALSRDDPSAGVPLGFDLYDADGAALLHGRTGSARRIPYRSIRRMNADNRLMNLVIPARLYFFRQQ